jgi:hypothetical protein
MNDYITQMISKYRKLGVIIDTGVLLLYIVGSINPSLIRNYARTASYDENDFIEVSKFTDLFDKKITTPHILTETSDLLKDGYDMHKALKGFICSSEEKFIESREIAECESYTRFGLADSSIIEIARNSHLIFTADNRLYGYLTSMGIDAVSMDDLKSEYLN